MELRMLNGWILCEKPVEESVEKNEFGLFIATKSKPKTLKRLKVISSSMDKVKPGDHIEIIDRGNSVDHEKGLIVNADNIVFIE